MVDFVNLEYPVGNYGLVEFDGSDFVVTSLFPVPGFLNGTVTASDQAATVTIDGNVFDLTSTALDAADVILFSFGAQFLVFSNAPLEVAQVLSFSEFEFGDYIVPCFLAGTRILTRRGEVAVEELEVGDEAMTLVGGGFARITWIGKRVMDTARARTPADVWPLRVRAGAFGEGKPHRDLFLSPDHSVHVNGTLIPVRYLENGITVARAPMREVTYYHVELERHDVLVAEGMAAESYLDTGNRADFDGTARDPARVVADEAAARQVWAERGCAPLHVRGPVVAEVRRLLEARIVEMGLQGAIDPELRLVVDGQAIAPRPFGDAWQFDLPAQVGGARLVSLAHVPAVTAYRSEDRRCLGVPVVRMLIDGRPVAVDAPFLRGGWHDAEDGMRWTNGMAALPPLRTLTVLLAPITPRGVATNREHSASAA